MEDRVGVLATDRRALGFVVSGEWVQKRFTPGEEPAALRAGAAAGLVATNRRLLAPWPRPETGGDALDVREVIESVNAQDTLVTETNRRILVFSAVQGLWARSGGSSTLSPPGPPEADHRVQPRSRARAASG
ncbi:MAG: hypothetical protein R3E53_07835 [Myxococcota bacterium]